MGLVRKAVPAVFRRPTWEERQKQLQQDQQEEQKQKKKKSKKSKKKKKEDQRIADENLTISMDEVPDVAANQSTASDVSAGGGGESDDDDNDRKPEAVDSATQRKRKRYDIATAESALAKDTPISASKNHQSTADRDDNVAALKKMKVASGKDDSAESPACDRMKKTDLIALDRERKKAFECARALSLTRKDEATALVRYPFNKFVVEAMVAEIYDFLEVNQKNRLTYEEFHGCCSKFTFEPDLDDHGRMQMRLYHDSPEAVVALSDVEKRWHDLYCITVPTLFEMDENTGDLIQRKLSSNSKSFHRIVRELCLQALDTGIISSKSDHALDILKVLRVRCTPMKMATATELIKKSNGHKTKEHSSVTKSTTDGEVPSGDATDSKNSGTISFDTAIPRFKESAASINVLSKPSPKLEDRIEFLAKERELRIEKNLPRSAKNERVAFADRLYTYACQILRRINARSPGIVGERRAKQLEQEKTRCVLTFRDVIYKVFPDRTPRMTFLLMDDIVQTIGSSQIPGQQAFLRWQCPKNGLNGIPMSLDSSVWIDIDNYRRVRAFLTGEQMPRDLREAEYQNRKRKSQDYARSSSGTTPHSAKPAPQSASKKPSSEASTQSGTAKAPPPPTAGVAKRAAEDAPQESLIKTAPSSAAKAATPPTTGAKRAAEAALQERRKKPTIRPAAPLKEERHKSQYHKGLRINPHHILCDEDHDGGTIIQPSANFPRGLRRLFLALNSGRHI